MPSRTHVLATTHTSKGASRLIHIGGVVAGCLWGLQRGSGRIGTGHAVSAATTPAGRPPCSKTVAVPYRQQFFIHEGPLLRMRDGQMPQQSPPLVVFSPLILRAAVGDCRQWSARPDGTLLVVEDASCWVVGLRQPGNHIPSRGSATASSCGSSSMFGVCILPEASTCCTARRQGWRLSPKNGGGRWTG